MICPKVLVFVTHDFLICCKGSWVGSICSDLFSSSFSTLMLTYWTRRWFSFNLEYMQLISEVQRTISSFFLLLTYIYIFCLWLHCCQVNLAKGTALMVHCYFPWPMWLNPYKCPYAQVKEKWLGFYVKAFVSQTMIPFWFSLFFSMLLSAPDRLQHHSTEVPYILWICLCLTVLCQYEMPFSRQFKCDL